MQQVSATPSDCLRVIYKKSVELTFVYLLEGCGKTQSEINDTIPHTRIDMGYWSTQNVPVHRHLYEVGVVPYRPSDRKTTTFSLEDLRKSLSQICNVKGVNTS